MISRININGLNSYNTNTKAQTQNFTGHGSPNNLNKKQKTVILASSAAGMTPVLAVLAKRKGFSLNPAKIFRTPVKDWAIFKYAPEGKFIKFEEPQIISVAAGSIAGGFIGGAIVDDKSNLKAKKREILNQILGNILVPVGCVGFGARQYEKYANRIENAMPQLSKNTKTTRFLNKCLKNLPNATCTVAFLGIGIYLGNRVSNYINEKLYHRKVDRNIKASDFAPHVDDLCMATSMMNKNSSFGDKLGRVIPLALIVPGYQTGIAQEH